MQQPCADCAPGAELWSQTLVDPDNRRRVDFTDRRQRLTSVCAEIEAGIPALVRKLLDDVVSGSVKLYTLHRALAERKGHRGLFLHGDYEPVAGGEHAVAFTRGWEEQRLLCCVPRFPYRLMNAVEKWPLGTVWGDRRLEVRYPGRYRNAFTGAVLDLAADAPLAQLYAEFPVALLIREPASS